MEDKFKRMYSNHVFKYVFKLNYLFKQYVILHIVRFIKPHDYTS
jgi:hypothetical protein